MTATIERAARLVYEPARRRLIGGGIPDGQYYVPTLDRFKSDPGLADPDLDFVEAPDVEAIAVELIAEHARFAHLAGRRVAYRWKRTGGKAGGKLTLGKCVKPSGLLRDETRADWFIWLAADNCLGLTNWQIEALVFHELLHADEDEHGKRQLRPHDFEGFGPEIEHYGLWDAGLREAGRAVQALQLPLFDGGLGQVDVG